MTDAREASETTQAHGARRRFQAASILPKIMTPWMALRPRTATIPMHSKGLPISPRC